MVPPSPLPVPSERQNLEGGQKDGSNFWKLLPHMARAQNVLRRSKNDNKTFFRFAPVHRKSLKVPHRLTDNMAKQTQTTSGIVVSLPFPFRFRD